MADTGFSVPVRLMAPLATLYAAHEDLQPVRTAAPKGGARLHYVEVPSDPCFRNPVTLSGRGGLTGTLDDYMRFCEMLRLGGIAPAGRVLSPQSTAFMLRNHLLADIPSMGLTSFSEQSTRGIRFGLAGAVVLEPAQSGAPGNLVGGMASTVFWIDHQLDLSVIFLTQLAPPSSYPAQPELKALVHGAFTQGPNSI